MAMEQAAAPEKAPSGWATLGRFLPYLWPAGEPRLRARVVMAVALVIDALLVLAGRLLMPWAPRRTSRPPIERMALRGGGRA